MERDFLPMDEGAAVFGLLRAPVGPIRRMQGGPCPHSAPLQASDCPEAVSSVDKSGWQAGKRPLSSSPNMQNVPFYKPSIGKAEIDEVVDTLQHGWLTTGPKTKQFEAEFARYIGQKHAIAVNSCTAALHLALEAVGIQAGHTVVVPTMTFAATAEVVRYFNAKPLLVDCRTEDFNIDVADANRRIAAAIERGEKVKAILPVHYGGQVVDVPGITALARKYQLKVIEDAAHCCPAHYRENPSEPWKSVGTAADISCYSFYANKTITTGEGGMACTQDDALADRMRIMSLHGDRKSVV